MRAEKLLVCMLGNQTGFVQVVEKPLCDFGALVIGG